MRKRIVVFLIDVLLLQLPLMAQNITTKRLKVEPETIYVVSGPEVKSLALKCASCIFEDVWLAVEEDTILVTADPHEPQSALVFLPEKISSFTLFSGKMAGAVLLYFIDAGTVAPKQRPSQRLKTTDCEPEPVAPAVWRQGLPAPSYTPSVTKVEHVVIHHSATGNTINDPYEVVRSIYTYHTQVNGWSDIGYNYLIAPDGTIFQGRDDKAIGEPDNILGAHMCGVNSGTMGICMLGTFTEVLPTLEAQTALVLLVQWKTAKEDIPLFGSEIHAIGPPSAGLPAHPLPYVCGHRDGCRSSYTECPGDRLYEHLDEIRELAALLDCQDENEEIKLAVYPNPTNAWVKVDFLWNFLEVVDMRGRIVETHPFREGEISLRELSSGMYLLRFYTTDHGKMIRKVVKI